jgi:hypothetical protein
MEAIGYIKFLQDQVEVMTVKPFKLSHTTRFDSLFSYDWELMMISSISKNKRKKAFFHVLANARISSWQQFNHINPCRLWAAPTWNPPEIRNPAGQHRGYSAFYSLSNQTLISKKFNESCWPNVLCCFALWCVQPGVFKRKRWRAGGSTAWSAQQRALPGASLVHVVRDQREWSLGSTQL